MSFLIFYLTSVIAVLLLKTYFSFIVIKDIVDSGYKLKFEKIKDFANNLKKDKLIYNKYVSYVPAVNLISLYFIIKEYNDTSYLLIDNLRILDLIDELDSNELNNYEENKTIKNAFLITIKSEINNIKEDICIKLKHDDKRSKIWIRFEDNKIVITRSKGPISKLDEVEQVKCLKEYFKSVKDEIKDTITPSQLEEHLNINYSIDLNNIKLENLTINDIEPYEEETCFKKRKEQLILLKKELTKEDYKNDLNKTLKKY